MKILIFSPFSTDRAEKIMNSFIIQLVEKLKNDGLNIFNFIDSKFTKKRLMNEIKNVNPKIIIFIGHAKNEVFNISPKCLNNKIIYFIGCYSKKWFDEKIAKFSKLFMGYSSEYSLPMKGKGIYSNELIEIENKIIKLICNKNNAFSIQNEAIIIYNRYLDIFKSANDNFHYGVFINNRNSLCVIES